MKRGDRLRVTRRRLAEGGRAEHLVVRVGSTRILQAYGAGSAVTELLAGLRALGYDVEERLGAADPARPGLPTNDPRVRRRSA